VSKHAPLWNCHPVGSTGCIIPILLSHSYNSQAYMLLAPWPVCFVDWWIRTWSLLHKHGSRNQLCALCPMAKRRIPLSRLKSREAYMILASLSPCFFWWLWNLLWLIFQIIFIISPIQAYQGCPPSNLQCSVFTGMVAHVSLVWIIRNIIPFVRMNATTAYSHASQDPCVHL
jgi:hypothetical protein